MSSDKEDLKLVTKRRKIFLNLQNQTYDTLELICSNIVRISEYSSHAFNGDSRISYAKVALHF